MSAIKVTIHGTGMGACALTGKETEGLTLTFEDGTVNNQFLSFKAFKQLIEMKAGKGAKPEPRPAPAVATAVLANGGK